MNLKNINEVIEGIRMSAEREVKDTAVRIKQRCEEEIRHAESNRLAIVLLAGASVEIGYYSDRSVSIHLGHFKDTKKGNRELAEKVKEIRQALGCRLEQQGKDLDDAKKRTVEFSLKPVDFPTVTIRFTRKLPKDAKCKIVRSRSSYSSLVCGV